MKTNNFLKTKHGLSLLRHITAEYGTWNEVKQCYDMPVTEAVSLAEEILTEELLDTLDAQQDWVDAFDPYDYYESRAKLDSLLQEAN